MFLLDIHNENMISNMRQELLRPKLEEREKKKSEQRCILQSPGSMGNNLSTSPKIVKGSLGVTGKVSVIGGHGFTPWKQPLAEMQGWAFAGTVLHRLAPLWVAACGLEFTWD
ncbi:hypothetical protein CQW23_32326 [Capsicum baccatum]|uniref:Uncharacterized protein n=1 Tax=Capsicum baccatum TaxID=33114 RepID=A0A2G2V556_CAPBA|nr:hypothetical protein CQW23_32326 [Capsicum baccatum]